MKAARLMFHPHRLLIMGSSGRGKTFLAKRLISKIFASQVSNVIVISPTAKKQFLDLEDKHPEVEWQFRTDVDNAVEDLQEEFERRENSDDTPSLLVVFDDVSGMAFINKRRKGVFAQMAVMSNHVNVSMLVIAHQATAVDSNFRDNVGSIIVFRTTRKNDALLLRDEYIPNLNMTQKDYLSFIQSIWDKNDFMFIHRPPRSKIQYYAGFNKRIRFKFQ